MMSFLTALLAILAFFYDLPYMHAVFWVSVDILILFFGVALLPLTILALVPLHRDYQSLTVFG